MNRGGGLHLEADIVNNSRVQIERDSRSSRSKRNVPNDRGRLELDHKRVLKRKGGDRMDFSDVLRKRVKHESSKGRDKGNMDGGRSDLSARKYEKCKATKNSQRLPNKGLKKTKKHKRVGRDHPVRAFSEQCDRDPGRAPPHNFNKKTRDLGIEGESGFTQWSKRKILRDRLDNRDHRDSRVGYVPGGRYSREALERVLHHHETWDGRRQCDVPNWIQPGELRAEWRRQYDIDDRWGSRSPRYDRERCRGPSNGQRH